MKKALFALFALALLLVSPLAHADSGATASAQPATVLSEPGILPDSPFYFFDKLATKMHRWFIFDQKALAEYDLKIANERLAEASAMYDKDNAEVGNAALESYKEAMQQVAEDVKAAKSAGDSIGEVDATALSALYEHKKLLNVIMDAQTNNESVGKAIKESADMETELRGIAGDGAKSEPVEGSDHRSGTGETMSTEHQSETGAAMSEEHRNDDHSAEKSILSEPRREDGNGDKTEEKSL